MKTRAQKKNPPPRGEGESKGREPNEDGVWTFKNGWLKPALNFIGLAISTWASGLNWPNVLNGEIPASIDWTRSPNNMTDYSHAQNLQDKWKADTKMIKAIDRLPGKKTMTERVVKRIMQAKKRLKL